jgi:hypothetical protein
MTEKEALKTRPRMSPKRVDQINPSYPLQQRQQPWNTGRVLDKERRKLPNQSGDDDRNKPA